MAMAWHQIKNSKVSVEVSEAMIKAGIDAIGTIPDRRSLNIPIRLEASLVLLVYMAMQEQFMREHPGHGI